MRFTNGKLSDFRVEDLMKKVQESGKSMNTIRVDGDDTYFISIHYKDFFGPRGIDDPDTEYYIDIVKEDHNGNQKRLYIMDNTYDTADGIVRCYNRWIRKVPLKEDLNQDQAELNKLLSTGATLNKVLNSTALSSKRYNIKVDQPDRMNRNIRNQQSGKVNDLKNNKAIDQNRRIKSINTTTMNNSTDPNKTTIEIVTEDFDNQDVQSFIGKPLKDFLRTIDHRTKLIVDGNFKNQGDSGDDIAGINGLSHDIPWYMAENKIKDIKIADRNNKKYYDYKIITEDFDEYGDKVYSWQDMPYSVTKQYSILRDATDNFTLCVATLYNGEKYWYQIDDDNKHSDVLLLSADNHDWLVNNYNSFFLYSKFSNHAIYYNLYLNFYFLNIQINLAIAYQDFELI